MSESCNHMCSQCTSSCTERESVQREYKKAQELSHVKKVIGIVSGKGGVGKSLVTALLAAKMQQLGYSTAILDADITGPSIPKAFGLHDRAQGNADGFVPVETKTGIKVMSVNVLLENEDDPVISRGPLIAGTVKQFWQDVIWGDIDFMFVDMPPGTGDVPLTVLHYLPVDGIVVVTSPQELVKMIVGKSVKMAKRLGVPVLGIVENMSYFECPTCYDKHYIFGQGQTHELADKFGIDSVSQIPLAPQITATCDEGKMEFFNQSWLDELVRKLISQLN